MAHVVAWHDSSRNAIDPTLGNSTHPNLSHMDVRMHMLGFPARLCLDELATNTFPLMAFTKAIVYIFVNIHI